MTGDITWYRPGSEVPAYLVAGAGGEVPERGEPLEIVGENDEHPEVGALTAPENFVATLVDVPADFDHRSRLTDPPEYAEGDLVGPVTVLVQHYIDWFYADPTGVNAGDVAVVGPDGVRAYDDTDTTGDNPLAPVGRVWYSGGDAEQTANKVAVIRQYG